MDRKEPALKSIAPGLSPGRVPFWLRQKSLVSVSSHTLRPGGLTLTRRAVEFCDFSGPDRILDVGCGYGMTLGYLHDHHGITCTGIDPDDGLIRRTGQKFTGTARLVRAALPRLPFPSGTWNGIFCECVLSLSSDPSAWLTECYRLLGTNGKLVVTDLYIRKWMPPRDFGPGPDRKNRSCASGARTLMEMMSAIEGAGFKIDIIEDHTKLLSQLGTPALHKKTGYCMIIAGKYR